MSSKERLKILQMVEDQSITPQDGVALLEMVAQVEQSGVVSAETPPSRSNKPRWLRVKLFNAKTNQSTVNVTIPLGLVEVSRRMGARFVPDMDETQYAQLIQQAQNGKRGQIYAATNAVGNERIEIVVE